MSAVIPTFIAQKWFMPVSEEDIMEINGNGNGEEHPEGNFGG